MIILRWADDFVAGLEHRDDAERSCTPTRPGSSSSGAMPLALVPPRGSENRRRSGFSSFTHMCGKTRAGRFWLRRVTEAERMRAKLKDVKVEPKRRRHQPMPVQGLWLASVVRGHFAYYGVPGSSDAITAFGYQVARHWIKALRRRSQRTRLTWAPMTAMSATGYRPLVYSTRSPRCASTPTPAAGAQCVSCARWDLCGGPPGRAVPTATPLLWDQARQLIKNLL